MSDHLPECYHVHVEHVAFLCICDRLRQAEQRGREAFVTHPGLAAAYAKGQRDALATLDACQSVDDAVALLKSIGLDITYTDEGLEVIARQIVRYGQRDEREAAAQRVLAVEWGWFDDTQQEATINRDDAVRAAFGGDSR